MHTVAFGFLGVVAGVVYAFGGLAIDTAVTLGWMTTEETPGLSIGTILAFQALIGMPLIFALFGVVSGGVVAVLYAVASKVLASSRYLNRL